MTINKKYVISFYFLFLFLQAFVAASASATVDVQPLSVTRSPSSVVAGGTLGVSWLIRNNGTSTASSSYSQVRITTSSSSYGNSSNNVGSPKATGSIGPGSSVVQSTSVTAPTTPGTYYVWVVADNTSVLSQTNTSNDFAVSSSFTVTAPTTVDIQPLNVNRSPSSVVAGGSLGVSWQIRNNGTGTASSSYSQVRITTSSSSYGNSSNNVGSPKSTGSIGPGSTISQSTSVTAPTTPGTYYVWIVADNTGVLSQTNTSNDFAHSSSFTVTAPTTVDVQPLNVTRSPSSVVAGGSLGISWQIRNNGTGTASSSYSQVRITTSSSSYGNSSNNVGSPQATGSIGPGATISQSTSVTAPTTPGTYYVWIVADNTAVLSQTNTSNDFAVSSSFTVTAATTVDVEPLSVTRSPSSVVAGGTLGVSWLIRNNGTGTAASSYSQVRISTSSSYHGGPTANVGSPQATGSIAPGASVAQSTSVTAPTTPGTYYVWIVADNTSVLTQTDTSNDFAVSASFTVTTATTVDVEPLSVTRSPSSVVAGGTLGVSWLIRNNGTGTADSSYSQVRISTSSSYHGGPTANVGSPQATGSIAPGASVAQSTSVTAPTTPGTYYVWIVADNTSVLTQTDPNNDFAVSAAFTVTTATTVDVEPLSVTRSPSSVVAGGTLGVSWLIRNNGTGTAASSYSQVRISTSSSYHGGPTANVGSPQATGSIAPGATIAQSTSVTAPTTPGTYYVWVVADNTSVLTQTDPNNDFAVSTSFTVTSSVSAPSISSVSPNPMPGSSSNQLVTIYGSNFQNGATLTFIDAGGATFQSQLSKLTFVSSGQIDYQINNANDVGTWQARVNNPDGQNSGWASFTVTSAAPGAFILSNDPPVWDDQSPAGPSVQLRWTPSSYATSYEVYRDGAKIYPISGALTERTFRNELGLSSGQTYNFYIIAYNAVGSTQSNTVSVGPMPYAPTSPSVSFASPNYDHSR